MKIDKIHPYVYNISALILGIGVFAALFLLDIQEDIRYHIIYLIKYVESGTLPVPPLYYLTIYTLSGFSLSIETLGYTAIVVLGFSVLIKYKLTTLLIDYLSNYKINRGIIYPLSFFLLIFMSVISGKNLYLGEPSPNVWHNSTVIFLMPFALLLFLYTAKIINEGRKQKYVIILFVLILINALIKPSFLFVYVALPILYLIYYGFNRTFWLFTIASIFALLLIVSETAYIYFSSKDPFSFVASQEKNEVIIAPFEVWSYYSKVIPLSFLSSIVFPLGYLVIYPKSIKENFFLFLSWMFFLGSVLIFSLFAESGYRMYHANFSWQIIPSMYLLFTVCIADLLKKLQIPSENLFDIIKTMKWENKLLFALFFLHVISGIGYLFKLLYFQNFW